MSALRRALRHRTPLRSARVSNRRSCSRSAARLSGCFAQARPLGARCRTRRAAPRSPSRPRTLWPPSASGCVAGSRPAGGVRACAAGHSLAVPGVLACSALLIVCTSRVGDCSRPGSRHSRTRCAVCRRCSPRSSEGQHWSFGMPWCDCPVRAVGDQVPAPPVLLGRSSTSLPAGPIMHSLSVVRLPISIVTPLPDRPLVAPFRRRTRPSLVPLRRSPSSFATSSGITQGVHDSVDRRPSDLAFEAVSSVHHFPVVSVLQGHSGPDFSHRHCPPILAGQAPRRNVAVSFSPRSSPVAGSSDPPLVFGAGTNWRVLRTCDTHPCPRGLTLVCHFQVHPRVCGEAPNPARCPRGRAGPSPLLRCTGRCSSWSGASGSRAITRSVSLPSACFERQLGQRLAAFLARVGDRVDSLRVFSTTTQPGWGTPADADRVDGLVDAKHPGQVLDVSWEVRGPAPRIPSSPAGTRPRRR